VDRPNFTIWWKIHGLSGMKTNNSLYSSGYALAMLNERITSIERKNLTSSSTITISGFTAADNGVTVQCTFLKRNGKRKNANVSIDCSAGNADIISQSNLVGLASLVLLIPLVLIVVFVVAVIAKYFCCRSAVASDKPLESSQYVNVPSAQESGDKHTEETRDGLTYATLDFSAESGKNGIISSETCVEYTTIAGTRKGRTS
jgi:hypothetical protein